MHESAASQSTAEAPPQAFPPTRWSVVLAAAQSPSADVDAALETICRAYWYPLYAFVRRSGQSPPDAQDLTQEFFRHLLEKRWLAAANREKGRLRTFLITALKRFMANEWRRASSQRRGGGIPQLPLDTAIAETRYAADPAAALGAEAIFDREWALRLLEVTMQRLEAEFAAAGKQSEFATLKSCLTAAHRSIDYASVAQSLGLSEGAARVAVHRLRKRFREMYREQIAQTLPEEADVESELRYLAGALAHE